MAKDKVKYPDALEQAKYDNEPETTTGEATRALPIELTAQPVKPAQPEPVVAPVVATKPAKKVKFLEVLRYKVLKDKTISMFGHMTTIRAGDIVSAETHGPDGIKRLLEAVQLEEIKPEAMAS